MGCKGGGKGLYLRCVCVYAAFAGLPFLISNPVFVYFKGKDKLKFNNFKEF